MLLIIGGAALGALVISTPLPLLKRIFGSLGSFFKDGPSKQDYLEETAGRIRQRLDPPDLRSLGRQIEITITRDGLRLELLDAAQQTFSPAAARRSPPAPSACSR